MDFLAGAKNIYSVWIQRGFLLLVCLAVSYLGLLGLDVPLPGTPALTLHLSIILFGELFLLSWCLGRWFEGEPSLQRLDSFIFVFLLANLFLLRPFMLYTLRDTFPEAPTLSRIQPFIKPAYNLLAVVCGLFAVFSFRQLNAFHRDLVASIQHKRQGERELEGQRRADFANSHPRLAGIPLAGKLARFGAGEGWGILMAVFALLVLGAALRLWNLDALVPYADEYRHLNAAKSWMAGEPLSQIAYRRSLYTVTLPVYISFRALGVSLWSARLAGVIVHLLAVIPIYLLARRIGKGVAILAVGLYLVDPWLVLTSRLVREYA